MSDPVRILQVLSTLDRGGAEQVVMNWYRMIDRSMIQFDFVVEDYGREYAHEAEILSLGGRIFRVSRPLPNIVNYVWEWNKLLNAHPEWKVVHAHHTSPAAVFLTIARLKGRRAIAHSHIAGNDGSAKGAIKRVARLPIRYIASDLMACSSEAATWMFGGRTAEVLPNGIDAEVFRFSMERARVLRDQLGLDDSVLIGHVGRFHEQKNHRRILEIFREIAKRSPNVNLLLVGDGPRRAELEEYSQALGIENVVKFLGVRKDIPDLLGVFDVMLFPSFYEGLPVSLVEAQAAGLPVVMSDTISREVVLTNLVRTLPLSASNSDWAQATLSAAIPAVIGARSQQCDAVKNSDFQIDRSIARIEGLYGEIR